MGSEEADLRHHARRWLLGAALFACAALAGCSTSGPPSTFEELGNEAVTHGFGGLYPPDSREPGEFTFGVGDTMMVDVTNSPEFTAAYTVRQDGKVYVAILGDLQAAGLTPADMKRKFENKLSIYLKPGFVVTVAVGAVVSKAFYVAAHNPLVGGYVVRKVPHPGDVTLFDVWVASGSPSTLLDDDTHVKVIRGDPRHPLVYTINVREILVAGYTGGNIQIRPDDIVYMPTTLWGQFNEFVTGLSLPFTGLLRISATVIATDRAYRVISGDDQYGIGGGFYGP
jgi:hypothetical protein